jgi:lipopolysaccharide transport system ATP-binding protein
VLHDDGAPAAEFSCDEPIRIRVRLLIREQTPDMILDLTVFTLDGIRVLFTDFRDGDPSIAERLGVGLHTFEIRIPGRVLASMTYTIGMAAYRRIGFEENQHYFDFQPRCGQFTLRDLVSIRQDRPGVLGLLLPWNHQRQDIPD